MPNKVAVITGANGGLGVSVTRAFLDAGCTVVGISRSIRREDFNHPAFVPVAAELANGPAVAALAESIAQKHGRIDTLVHLVGGFAGGAVASTSDADFKRMLDINLRSAFLVFRAFLPHLGRGPGGRIIAIGSRAAVSPAAGIAAYAASKAALVSLVKSVALENPGLTANVILPGTIDTPANRAADPNADFSKWIPPGKIAATIMWLASDAASHISGAVIPIYGPDAG